MTEVWRGLATVTNEEIEREVVATLLTSRSQAEAALAFTVLRTSVTEPSLLFLINLREILDELPATPFWCDGTIARLHDALGYEFTGHSYRMRFEDENGVYGLEFGGETTTCEEIVVHKLGERYVLCGDCDSVIEPTFVMLLLEHPALIDRLLEALAEMGVPLEPSFYLLLDDFISEHAAQAAEELLEL